MNVQLGAGNMRLPGFLNVDIRPTEATDLIGHAGRLPSLGDGTVDLMFCNAVFEHLFPAQHLAAVAEWRRVLSPRDGVMVCLGIPDFEAVARVYLEGLRGNARGIVGGARFDLFNAYRYTHGAPESATTRQEWEEWRPEERPNDAPSGYVPWLHKCLLDAVYLTRLLEAGGLHAALFRYRFPGEEHAMNLGFVAGPLPLPTPKDQAVSDALARIPGAHCFVDGGSVALCPSTAASDLMLEYVQGLM